MKGDFVIKNNASKVAARIITIILIFICTVALVQSVMLFKDYAQSGQYSMTVVFIYLLLSPFMFGAAIFQAIGVHKISQGKKAGSALNIGYGFLAMAMVDALIYVPIHYESDEMASFLILAAIELICVLIVFFYVQNIGPKAMAVFGAVLLTASVGLELIEACRYVSEVGVDFNVIYYMCKKVGNMLFAVLSILLATGLKINLMERKD